MSFQILVTSIFNSRSHKFIILLGSNLGLSLMNPLGAKVACLANTFPFSQTRPRGSLIIEIENINSDSPPPLVIFN